MTIRIPVEKLKIDEGWYVADLRTVADCEEAIVHLTREITHINLRLRGAPPEVPGQLPPQWVAQTEAARSVKMSIRELARRRQGELNRIARIALNENSRQRLINDFRSMFPDQFAAVLSVSRDRHTA